MSRFTESIVEDAALLSGELRAPNAANPVETKHG
jgi:hypothetical protein